jgi:ribonucleoside-diphosphate reductase alpha chain
MNLFIEGVNAAKLTAAHFHSWEIGLKTGMYYLRTKAAADALSGLGVDLSKYKSQKTEEVKPAPSEPVQQYEVTKVVTDLPVELSHNSQELADLAAKLTSDIVCSLDSGPDGCVACGS